MDKAKRKIVSALDGLRNLQSSAKAELDVKEVLTPSDFCLTKVVRHGFPHDPRCIAFDPVQHLLAIGTAHGSIRILGDAGVDYHLKHESDSAVLHLQFLVNEGALISSCKDDTIHLWNFRQKVPEIVHSLQMQKEQVTCIHLPYQSKWLYVGTDKGNVYVVSIGPFTLSGYVINWNKAIDLSCRTHPGSVKHLSDCPGDDSKLLIGFEKGSVALWSLTGREADRFTCDQPLRAISWHWDARQFVCALADGSLCMWSTKKPSEPTQRWAPHSKDSGLSSQQRSPDEGRRGPREKCRSMGQVEWKHGHDGDELIVFSGGMPLDDSGVLPAITVLRGGKSATVLEMEHPIVAFSTLCASPFPNAVQEPYAVAVLLKSDFLIVDLTTPGYPCFENPYPMDIHESPVTVCAYFSDCPFDLIGALTVVGKKQRRQGFSEKNWPITGGHSRENATGHNELVLTGHQDGSVKFWQASGEHLQILYKLKTGRHFERPADSQVRDTNCYSVTHIELCPDSRCLLIAGQAAQVTFFRFVKSECSNEIAVLEVPILAAAAAQEATESTATSKRQASSRVELKRQGSFAGSTGSHSSDTSEGSQKDYFLPLKVRGGPLKRPGGYQPELVCLIPWLSSSTPVNITALALNTAYSLIAIGTDHGLAIVDIAQHILVWSWMTSELYGSSDPFVRQPPCRPQLSTASDSSVNDHGPTSPSPAIERLQEPWISESPTELTRVFELPSETQLEGMFQRCVTTSVVIQPGVGALIDAGESFGDSGAKASTPYATQRSIDVADFYSSEPAPVPPPRRAKSARATAGDGAPAQRRVALVIEPTDQKGNNKNDDVGKKSTKKQSISRLSSLPISDTTTTGAAPMTTATVAATAAAESTSPIPRCGSGAAECDSGSPTEHRAKFKKRSSVSQLTTRARAFIARAVADSEPEPSTPTAEHLSPWDADLQRSQSVKDGAGKRHQFSELVKRISNRETKAIKKDKDRPSVQQHSAPSSSPFAANGKIYSPSDGVKDTGTPLDSPSSSSGKTVGFSLKNTGSASPSSGTGKGMNRLATDSRTRSQGSGAFLLRRPFQKAQTVAYCTEQAADAPFLQQSSVADGKEQVRSRSSSVSSQDNVVISEMISSLSFIESFSKRNEPSEIPSLWVGTSLGSCIVLNLIVPSDRLTGTVFAAPSGSILQVKGHLLHTAFLDHRFCLLAPATDSFRDAAKESDGLPKNK
uniref:Lethal giant larvae homologue 2 domain-containing protein n=1 Tax=Plectus sambesii TaxID=2011161 RepID=A0A914XGW2_9BILA